MTHLIEGRKLFILPMTSEEPLPFEEIFAIEDINAAQQAFEMAQIFQGAVEGNGHFNLNQASDIANSDPNMTVVTPLDQILTQAHDLVEEMVNRVNQLLDNLLDIVLPQKQQEQIHAAISYAFTNLNTQTTDAWIFYESKSAHSTTYQYNIVFAVQNESTGGLIYGVPMGMTIKVDREYERVLFITLKNKVSYSVHVEALKVSELLESYINKPMLSNWEQN